MKNEGLKEGWNKRPPLQEELRIEEEIPRNTPPPNPARKDPRPEMGGKIDVTPKDVNVDDSGIDYSGTI